jgi:hypothetical protein
MNVLMMDPMKRPVMSKYLRLEIYKYLDLGELVSLISKLSRQERELLEDTSQISQTQRIFKI